MTLKNKTCQHIENLNELKFPKAYVCNECIKTGDRWVHLRTCQTCGITHCCDSSPNHHATKHYLATQHPVVISAEHGEQWIWCYEDQQIASY